MNTAIRGRCRPSSLTDQVSGEETEIDTGHVAALGLMSSSRQAQVSRARPNVMPTLDDPWNLLAFLLEPLIVVVSESSQRDFS
ncbi:hypothetical protein RRG08_018155 [Elysia crispata]|uniref:Uncharacterized protein n=1 Tax=Elysia crispata TaxID=231223 RepID=A0AAE1E6G8_9GAST|nr:hypothetical protein RRG08_018155 [Elysia crispata]